MANVAPLLTNTANGGSSYHVQPPHKYTARHPNLLRMKILKTSVLTQKDNQDNKLQGTESDRDNTNEQSGYILHGREHTS